MKTTSGKQARAKKATSLTVNALLERSRASVVNLYPHVHDAFADLAGFEDAVRACVSAGRGELACQLAAFVPEALRARPLAIAARAGAVSVDEVIDTALRARAESGSAVFPAHAPRWATMAFGVVRELDGKTARTELNAGIDEIIEQALEEEAPPWTRFEGDSGRLSPFRDLFDQQISAGESESVWRVFARGLASYPSAVGQAVKVDSALLFGLGDGAKRVLALLGAMKPSDRWFALMHDPAALRACAKWSRDDIRALLALESAENFRLQLAWELLGAGTLDLVQHVLFPVGAERDEAWNDAERCLQAGDADAVKAFVADKYWGWYPASATERRVKAGIESLAKASERVRNSGKSPNENDIIMVANLAIDRGEHDLLDALESALEAVYTSSGKAPYKRGKGWLDLRVRLAAARGGPSAALEVLKADVKHLEEMQSERRNAQEKRTVAREFAARALAHGCPEIALTMAKKGLEKSVPEALTVEIPRAFLPIGPGAALEVFDALAKVSNIPSALLWRTGGISLLGQLWTAVLGQGDEI